MVSFKGVLYQSGHIEFPRESNEWAFRKMDRELRDGKRHRIVMKPDVAPVKLECSSSVEPSQAQWLDRMQDLLNASDTVFLDRKDQALRFRSAVHDVNKHCQLITLATQQDIDEFAEDHWHKIAFFYATRHDGFQFNVGTLITLKKNEQPREKTIELVTHLVESEPGARPHVTFNATGSHAAVEIVNWRSSVPEGESGRFLMPDTQIRLLVTLAKQPLTFCHEYRSEYKNHAYIFEGEKLENRIRRMLRRKRDTQEDG